MADSRGCNSITLLSITPRFDDRGKCHFDYLEDGSSADRRITLTRQSYSVKRLLNGKRKTRIRSWITIPKLTCLMSVVDSQTF